MTAEGGQNMDNNSFISMVNNLKTVQEKSRKEDRSGGGGDPALFSRLMDEEVKEKGSPRSKEQGAIEGEKKSDADKKAQDRKETEQREAELAEQQKKGSNLTPMQNFLFNLVLKNPDALSLSEKQSLGLDKLKQNVNLKDLNSLMAQRGLNYSELTSDHIFELNQKGSLAEAKAFLDELARQKKDGTLEQRAKTKLVEDASASTRTHTTEDVKDSGKPEGPAQAEKQEAMQEAARTRRTEVIDQIVSHMELQNVANRTELSLRLNPEYLGELKMKLTFEDGKLSIDAETPSKLVRETLEEGADDMKKQFGEKGIKLDRVRVKLVDTVN